MENMSLPVACSLTEPEFRERRSTVLRKVSEAAAEVKEVESGFAYRFPPDGELITELAKLVMLERECCPFLRFVLTVEPGGGPIWLEITGSQGAKEFIASILRSD